MLTQINGEIKKEALIAGEKNGTPGIREQLKALAFKLRYSAVKLSRNRLMVVSLNEKLIAKTKDIAGFLRRFPIGGPVMLISPALPLPRRKYVRPFLFVPEECRSRYQKAETGRAAAARKPVRPKGSLNRKQVRGML